MAAPTPGIISWQNAGSALLVGGGLLVASSFMPSALNPAASAVPSSALLIGGVGVAAVGGALSLIRGDV